MLKNVYKLSDGHNIVSVICNQKTIEKIVRIMMGYVNLIEEDNINTVIMNICLYEDVYEVNDDLMTENIKLHCDKDGYVYKGEPIIINNISDNIVYKIKKNEVAVYGYAKDEYYIEIVRLIRMCFQLGLRFNGYRKLHISILSKNVTWGLVGDKGAGKTTMLLHMLNNGYYLTSNDKALISREGKCVGTCQRIGIQEYTMDKYNIQKNDAIIIGKKYYLWPIDLVNKYGTLIKKQVVLDAILVLNYQAGSDLQISEIHDVQYKKKLYDSFVCDFSDKSEMNEIGKIIIECNEWIMPNEEQDICDKLLTKRWIEVQGEFESLDIERLASYIKS